MTLKPGTKGKPRLWHGVLRDDKGHIVWTCSHIHRNRDFGNQYQCAAIACAKEELRRAQASAFLLMHGTFL